MNAGFQVVIADSTPAAIEQLRALGSEGFQAVLTDYWMPGGTGADLIRFIQNFDPTLSTILISAMGEKQMLTEAICEGAFAFLDKPFFPTTLRELTVKAVEATTAKRRLRSAAQAAQSVGRSQLMLLDQQAAALDGRLEIYFQPLAQASGDFVSVFPLDDRNYVILASDVSGHDLKAAYQSSYFHGLARGMMERGASVEEVFYFFNNLLLETWNKDNHIEISLAACGIHADLQNLRIRSINAGFPAPYLVDGEGWGCPLNDETTSPLGWFDDLSHPREHSVTIGHVVFWSDGLGDLADRLKADPLALSYRLCRDRADSAKLTLQSEDDIVVVRASLGVDGSIAGMPFAILHRVCLGSEFGDIDAIQNYCENSLRVALPNAPEEKIASVIICLREALLNALIHGCRRRDDQTARVQAAFLPSTQTLRVRVSDSGPGHKFDLDHHETAAADDLLTEHRGLVLLKNLPDFTSFSRRGSVVAMEFAV